MHAAGLRRAGFAAIIATALVMLGAALHGMTRVDTSLEIAAATPRERPLFVLDVSRQHGFAPGRECRDERPPSRRL
jgi:hypothetical protein